MNQEEEAAVNQEEVVVYQEEVVAYQEQEGEDENATGPSKLRISFSTVR